MCHYSFEKSSCQLSTQLQADKNVVMLQIWIVEASNFDLHIPECHKRHASLSLYIGIKALSILRYSWSTVS